MKAKTYLLVLTMLLGYSLVMAAYTSPGWTYGYDLGIARGDNAGSAENLAPLAQARVQLELFRFLNARIGLGFTPLHATKSSPKGYSTSTFLADYRFVVQPLRKDKVSPFLYAGTGGSLDLSKSNADIIPHYPFGIGFSAPLKKGMLLEVAAGYNLTNNDNLDMVVRGPNDTNWLTGNRQDGFFSLTFGLSYFNDEEEPAPAPKPVPVKPTVVTPPPAPKPVIVEAPAPTPPKVVTVTPVDTGNLDSDGDGLSDADEAKYKTDPKKADTDGDGLNDFAELMTYKTDPLNPDTDGDKLSDFAEVMQHKTNPLNRDTDNDKLDDYAEVMTHKTNPLNPDTDGDKLDDYAEVMTHKTNPLVQDSDGDKLSDYAEVMEYKTNPLNPDTDGDTLKDGEEVLTYKTDPLQMDTDKGSVDDGKEVAENKNPLDPKDDVMALTKGSSFTLEGVLFETNKSTILPVSAEILQKAYDALAANPTVNIIIIGHTDNVGSDASNMTLSMNRAAAVKKWLVDKGIAATRIKTGGKGETEPRATNDTAEGRALNRRIEFDIEN